MIVQSVRGPLDSADLGSVLMHEHIALLSPEAEANYPCGWTEDEIVDLAVRELEAVADAGINSMVDLTVIPMGRDVRRIQRIAERTRLNILVATGIFTFDELPGPFAVTAPNGPDPLIEKFVSDITVGTAGTGIRACVIKCATDKQGVTPGVDRVLRAVARAHRATGAPISTHTNAACQTGLDQQRIFAEEGVELSRVVIGHCGDSADLDYLESLAQRGSYLGMDRFGISTPPLEQRVDTVVRMCERGYAEQMVLSHDYASFNDHLSSDFYAANPGWNYLFVSEKVVPALLERGVSEAQVRMMLVDNPRRLFEHATAY